MPLLLVHVRIHELEEKLKIRYYIRSDTGCFLRENINNFMTRESTSQKNSHYFAQNGSYLFKAYQYFTYIWIFFIPRAFIILWPMSFPITKTHPTEIVFTMVTLHMVTASIFFYANIAFWALQNKINTKNYN